MVNIFAKLFSSKKWVTVLAALIVDGLVFATLPVELATQIATFVTITAGIYVAGQSVVDATGNHDYE